MILHPGNIAAFLGKPFLRDAAKDDPLTPDMFDAAAATRVTTLPVPAFTLRANPQRLAAHGVTVADFSQAVRQLMAADQPLTPESPVTINGQSYRLGDLADFDSP